MEEPLDIAGDPAAVTPLVLVSLLVWFSSPQADYARGMALARAGRWTEARIALESGRRKAPGDKRFPIELAGISYRLKDRRTAQRWLGRALALDPADSYANDFLGAIFLLDGNTEAALKYWNRAGKPRIEAARFEPQPSLDPVLLDRALAFAPAGVLRRDEYRASRRRLELLDAFVTPRIDLDTREDDGAFEAVIRGRERRPGWLAAARGLPFQTVYGDFPNLLRGELSVHSLARWDPNKRRIAAGFSGPVARDPAWRWDLSFDARDENWSMADLGAFNLRSAGASFGLRHLTASGIEWQASGGVSNRSLPASISPGGLLLKAGFGADRDLLSVPERRFNVRGSATLDFGRLLSGDRAPFAKAQAGVEARWQPAVAYNASARLRAGRIAGTAPFDELFLVGLERDTDLWIRGHIGTHEGKKGASPVGRDFALGNFDFTRRIWAPGFLTLSAGPFLDAGRVDGSCRAGSRLCGRWLLDPGVEGTVRLPGGPGVSFSYSRGAFYATVSP